MRGYAHVDQGGPRRTRDLLFLGTELGLWISLDGGKQWAQYKGGDFPNVAVRDLAIHPRDDDLVIAHARPRHLDRRRHHAAARADATRCSRATPRSCRPSRPCSVSSRCGGWARATPCSRARTRPGDALITYYQQKRHIFGDFKIEVLDADGKLLDTLPTSKRRGLNRAAWSMRVKPPRVPPAATLAFGAATARACCPGPTP